MAKITRLTESDLMRIVKRIVSEQSSNQKIMPCPKDLSKIREALSREPQINIQVHPQFRDLLIVTPPKYLYKGQSCVAPRGDILRLS